MERYIIDVDNNKDRVVEVVNKLVFDHKRNIYILYKKHNYAQSIERLLLEDLRSRILESGAVSFFPKQKYTKEEHHDVFIQPTKYLRLEKAEKDDKSD